MNVPLPRPAVDVEHDRLSGLIRRLEPPAEQSAGAVGDAPLLLTPAEAAEVLRVDLSELRTMRTIGIGPDYHDVGRGLIRYARDSVLALVGDLGAGTLRSNTITVGLDAAGAFKLRNTGSPANYIIDMQGWYEVVSPETVTCDEDLTDRELPVSNPGSASECSTVLDGYTPVDTYVGDDGEAFWVSDEEQSPSPANPVVIQMEDSTARVQSQDPPSDQELKTLIDGAGFCEPELGADIEDALTDCATSPQSAPAMELGQTDDEAEMSVFAASQFDECVAATNYRRYEARTRACVNRISTGLLTYGKTVVGTFRFQMVTRTVAAAQGGSITNTTSVNVTKRTGEAWGAQITVEALYECNSTVCAGQSSYFKQEVGSSWKSGLGRSTIKVPYKGQARVNEGWRYRFTVPGFRDITGTWSRALYPRCDNSVVGGMGTSCVFTEATPVWGVSASGNTAGVGVHLRKAISSRLPVTLTRTEPKNRAANYRKACPKDLVRPDGYSCDEYPFQSTKQGAAAGGSVRVFDGCRLTQISGNGPTGWSRCMVPSSHNSNAGTFLGVFYRSNRVLPGDRFGVRVK